MTQYELIAMAKEAGFLYDMNAACTVRGNSAQLERFAALAEAKERERWSEVEQYLVAAAAGSMSRNNSEQIASELLEQIHDTRTTR